MPSQLKQSFVQDKTCPHFLVFCLSVTLFQTFTGFFTHKESCSKCLTTVILTPLQLQHSLLLALSLVNATIRSFVLGVWLEEMLHSCHILQDVDTSKLCSCPFFLTTGGFPASTEKPVAPFTSCLTQLSRLSNFQ